MDYKVAVCDDKRLDREKIQTFVERYAKENQLQIEISSYTCGEDLIKEYWKRKSPFDIVFLDMEMKVMDGMDVAREIRQIPDHNVLLVFITNYPDYMQDSFDVQANQYLMKPLQYDVFQKKMKDMSDNIYIEILNEAGEGVENEEGDICVTTLQNGAMPLIRFNLEDRGMLCRNAVCPCGRSSDVLVLKAGRKNDWIWNRDGTRKHAYVLMQVIHHMNFRSDGAIPIVPNPTGGL